MTCGHCLLHLGGASAALRALQDILLQLTGVGHIRHKRPATDDANRSAGGVTSALHSIMEQCWQQVRLAMYQSRNCVLLQVLP